MQKHHCQTAKSTCRHIKHFIFVVCFIHSFFGISQIPPDFYGLNGWMPPAIGGSASPGPTRWGGFVIRALY